MGGRAIRGRPAAFAVQRRGGRARPRSRRPSAARSRATVTFSKRLLSADAGLFWKRADCAPPRSARKDTFRRLTFSFLSPVCPSPAPAISLARGHGPGDAPGCVPGRRRLGRGRSKGACFPGALTGRGAALPSRSGSETEGNRSTAEARLGSCRSGKPSSSPSSPRPVLFQSNTISLLKPMGLGGEQHTLRRRYASGTSDRVRASWAPSGPRRAPRVRHSPARPRAGAGSSVTGTSDWAHTLERGPRSLLSREEPLLLVLGSGGAPGEAPAAGWELRPPRDGCEPT